MIELVLISIFFLAVIFCLIFGIIISYHFKRFTLVESTAIKKILSIFGIGSLVLIVLSLIFLIFTI